ncbi:xanthine and CO dehydrogenases maturation factor, XdhC/CoxF family [Pyrinomonas methylaliphatogenes]|uniref:Xanthine and CO dehydrogenases maturation factor, XdhC/CoxF family n=2 Tax=Pyrinomonas methylaliphatogenes TaxID=454194 RepID=A0A0B6WZF6_9BACT|nr:xanthine and CO dehydrogenases maturation factor, XdhC/CoxF family [Pyrinomonas methylaliphatogenes]
MEREGGSLTIIDAIERALERGALAALITIVQAERAVGRKLLVQEEGATAGDLGDEMLNRAAIAQAEIFLRSRVEAQTFKVEEFAPEIIAWRGARLLFERIAPEPHVVVCGAGHVGAALARLARSIGYRVTVIDDRADFVSREKFPDPDIALVAAEDWEQAISETIGTGRGVFAAIVTRGHKEDEKCLRAVLKARPDYVGMIGSRRRTNIVLRRLHAEGFDEAVLREVRAPIGLDIGAVTPEEVALSILAEMIAERRGGTGAPLSSWRRAANKGWIARSRRPQMK